MLRTTCQFLCLLGAFWSAAGVANADLIYQFSDIGGTPTTSFSTSVGGTVDVRVYLLETAPDTVLADEELFGASVRVTFDSPLGIAAVQNASDIFLNPAFTDPTPPASATPGEAGLTGSVGFDPFLTVDGSDRIYLGTFRFTGIAPGSVGLSALDRDSLSDDTVTGFGTVLDALINPGFATLTVTANTAAVPEPATWGLFLAGLSILAAQRISRGRGVGAFGWAVNQEKPT